MSPHEVIVSFTLRLSEVVIPSESKTSKFFLTNQDAGLGDISLHVLPDKPGKLLSSENEKLCSRDVSISNSNTAVNRKRPSINQKRNGPKIHPKGYQGGSIPASVGKLENSTNFCNSFQVS